MTFSPTAAVIKAIAANAPSGVVVASKTPADRPAKLARIQRIGGDDNTITASPRFICECWAGDEWSTEILAGQIHRIVNTQLTAHWVSTVDQDGAPVSVFIRWAKTETGPVRFPDESDQERFQFQFQVLLKTN